MNASASPSSGDGRQTVAGRGIAAVREVLDEFRGGSDERVARHADGSDVRAAVLGVLAEEPSNGYRIVRVLAERDGDDGPGAGAVYPALQLLADEGLATAEEVEGRRIWTLTTAGRAAADAARDRARPQPSARQGPADRIGAIARSGSVARAAAQLAQAAALAAQTGDRDQVDEVVDVLDDARRRVVSILARG